MKRTKKFRSNKFKTIETMKPYMKTTEVKGLYAPRAESESASEAVVQAAPTTNQGFSFLNGMGGIDGLISMMGKAQQMFKLFQQMGPMFKMLDSLGGSKALTASLNKSMGQRGLNRRLNAKARKK
jgi:hypothetical protein